MLMAYLLTTHRISNTMTAYQLLRNSLNFLGKKRESLRHCVLLDYMDNICNFPTSPPILQHPQILPSTELALPEILTPQL